MEVGYILETWRLLDLEYDDPYMNMAVEEAIPRVVSQESAPCTLRFWRNPNTIVVGCYQSVNLEVDLNACAKYQTQIVRRFTGGGTVYHDHGNLNYAISVPKAHRLVPTGDPIGILKRFSKIVASCLEALGLYSEIKSSSNIEVNQKKIYGAAGSMRWKTIFCHGSILVNSNIDILYHVLKFDDYPDTHFVKSVRKPVTTISRELNMMLSPKKVSRILLRCLEKKYGIQFFNGKLMKKEKKLADELYDKYSSYQWNFKI